MFQNLDKKGEKKRKYTLSIEKSSRKTENQNYETEVTKHTPY
jgi:hypothetical protein